MDAAGTAQRRLDEIVKSPHILTRIFQKSFRSEATGSILLLITTVLALVWADSLWAESYFVLLHTEIAVLVGANNLVLDMHELANDGLKVIFVLVVGREIKREVAVGELSSARKAFLPVAAAVGGMLLPALLNLALSFGQADMDGWRIPMATGIAFALGVLMGSVVCGFVGYVLLRHWLPEEKLEPAT